MKSFFLIFLPIIILIVFSILVYFFLSMLSDKNTAQFYTHRKTRLDINSFKVRSFILEFIRFSIFIFFIFFLFFFYILKLQNFENKFFFINNLIIYQLYIFNLIFICICLSFTFNINYLKKKQIDLGMLLNFLFFTAINLLTSNNILTIFINLEILNIIIIYSFTLMAYLNFYQKNNIEFRVNWLLFSISYQFILNFFSSIIFFLFFNLLLTQTYSSNFIFLNFFTTLDNISLNFYLIMIYISIFIKFGIGPWIFFKIEIYQGFNLSLLIIYTILYFTIILIFFFNLFIVYNLYINTKIILIFLIFLLIIGFIFSIFIFFYFNFFSFFSFSSLLNLILMLIQLYLILIYNLV